MKYGKQRGTFQRGITRRQLLRAGAAGGAGLLAASVLGCSSTNSKQPAKAGSEAKTPKRGGTISVVVTFDPQSTDPHTTTAASFRVMSDFYYSTPFRFKPNLDAYELEPDLVESWEQTDDLTYILHVRKGVKWHNLPPVNGRELVADDIKYSVERIATPKAAFQRNWMFEDVAKLETVDKYTVKMTTKRPFVPVINYLADRQSKVVAKEVADKADALETVYIGTGPFIVESFTRNVEMKLVRNPDYYVRGQPYLDAVSIPIVVDAAARLAGLRSREIDWGVVTYSDVEALRKTPGDLLFGSIPDTNGTNFRVRMNKPPFNDVRVRKALQLGVDRKKMIDAVAEGKGYPTGPIAPFLKEWALPEAELNKYLRYDPQEAKRLLAEAGFANGLKFVCQVSTRSGIKWADAAVVLKDQYKAIGVEVEIKPMEHTAFVASQVARNFETMTGSTQFEGSDPDILYNNLHSKGPRQFSDYNNPKMDELLEKQRTVFNKEERKKLIYDIQRLALEDLPEIYLFVLDGFIAWQPHLAGYKQGIGEYGLALRRCEEFWVDK